MPFSEIYGQARFAASYMGAKDTLWLEHVQIR